MTTKRILYIAQEITPYLADSPTATNCRYLPQAVQELGNEIRTFMPKFGSINERRNQLHEVIRLSGMNIIIDDTDHPLIIKVASIQAARMQIYFIDNEDFFKRKGTVCDDDGKEYSDNDERSIFYIRGVLETIKKLRWIPDIIDCHGWMGALTGLYMKTAYADDPCFKDSKVVYSLYNDDFKEPFSSKFADKIKFDGIKDNDLTDLMNKNVDFETLSRFAIEHADGVIQSEETINSNVLEFASKLGEKFLPYQGDATVSAQAINNFYDNL